MDSSFGTNPATLHNHLEPEKRQSAEASMLDSKENSQMESAQRPVTVDHGSTKESSGNPSRMSRGVQGFVGHGGQVLLKLAKFIGPGFMVSVAYIDPGNYATDTAAGASFQFKLLFIILMSNVFAIFLQSLCVKLGTVTGRNLAQNCREHLPKWLNITLYVLAESAIVATDIAEVAGSAIALNLLFKIPLIAGCAITAVDVIIILIFYNPSGSMRRLRVFEIFVMFLVLAVVGCFVVQLSYIKGIGVGQILQGYIPSPAIVEPEGLYLSCGILGATVMPHSLYLGSGIVQSRLREFDQQSGNSHAPQVNSEDPEKYRPSLAAINFSLKYAIAELAICLFSFALFVNSAILIVSGASLHDTEVAQSADLFDVHDLLSNTLAPAAGTIFALALLLSGTSAGIVCTIAGQMVSEGALQWTIPPWLRRLITRSISIIPSMIIVAALGQKGLSAALTASQVTLSVILPFVSAPLLYFTCRNKYMTVVTSGADGDGVVKMRNHWITTTFAILIWLVIVVMNIALLRLPGPCSTHLALFSILPTIFILGSTGYIGGSVLVAYKKAYPNHDFVALVRSESSIPAVEALGVKVVKGSHSDLDLITEEASKADIILNAADADDLELTKAVLAGIKKTTHFLTPILIHTSGTGLVTKEPTGKRDPNAKVYNDNNVNDIRYIPETAPHRNVDLEIFEADSAGYVSAYIIAPSTIYGTGHGPVNQISQQVPTLIKEILAQKQIVYVGDGTNEWNNVHIDDLVHLYIIVANLAQSELALAGDADSYTKFFWGSVGKHTWGNVAHQIGNILLPLRLIDSLEPKSIPFRPELGAISTNSLTVADRSLKNGWTPHGPPLEATLEETIHQVVKDQEQAKPQN